MTEEAQSLPVSANTLLHLVISMTGNNNFSSKDGQGHPRGKDSFITLSVVCHECSTVHVQFCTIILRDNRKQQDTEALSALLQAIFLYIKTRNWLIKKINALNIMVSFS